MAKDKKLFKNKNGNMTEIEWIRLIKDEKAFDTYMRKFNTTKSQCPPADMLSEGACFYCVECQTDCAKQVKEYKNHYSISNIKFPKGDVDESK